MSKKHERSQSSDDMLKHPSTKRAKEIDQNTPMEQLEEVLARNKSDHKPRNVLHWFRSKDIRQDDNRALHAASKKAKEGSGSLITLYLFSPKDMDWHGTSPARTDFILESLRGLKEQLQEKNIPLAMITAKERAEKTEDIMELLRTTTCRISMQTLSTKSTSSGGTPRSQSMCRNRRTCRSSCTMIKLSLYLVL